MATIAILSDSDLFMVKDHATSRFSSSVYACFIGSMPLRIIMLIQRPTNVSRSCDSFGSLRKGLKPDVVIAEHSLIRCALSLRLL